MLRLKYATYLSHSRLNEKIWTNKVNDDVLNHLILEWFFIWQSYLKHCSNLNTIVLTHGYIRWTEWKAKIWNYTHTHTHTHIYIYTVLSLQSYLTLWYPMNCTSPGSSVYGILQLRILEWVVLLSSRWSSQPRDRTYISCLLYWQASSLPLVPPESESEVAQLCPTPCDPMDCSLPSSSVHGIFQTRVQGNLPDLGIEPGSPMMQANALPSEPPWKL